MLQILSTASYLHQSVHASTNRRTHEAQLVEVFKWLNSEALEFSLTTHMGSNFFLTVEKVIGG